VRRARVQSARERARVHFQPLDDRAARSCVVCSLRDCAPPLLRARARARARKPHIEHTDRLERTQARRARRSLQRPGLPSSFKELTDDRHGTERRRVRIHHIFHVPTVGLPVYPSTLSRLSAMIKRESGSHVTATARKIGFPRNYFRARSLPILFSARENSFRRIKC